jgi:hypothetical protein
VNKAGAVTKKSGGMSRSFYVLLTPNIADQIKMGEMMKNEEEEGESGGMSEFLCVCVCVCVCVSVCLSGWR